jgi:hypothetical protein
MSKIIEITVSPTGQTTVQTKGFSGAACRGASEFIEKALGAVTGEQLTSEFFQQQSEQESLRQGS